MRSKLLAMMLLGSSAVFAQTNFYFGIGIGNQPRPGRYVMQPPPPPPQARFVPRSPGRGFIWVPGYWVAANNRYSWRDGYWSAPRGNGNGRNNWNSGRNNGWNSGRNNGNGNRNRDRDDD